MWLRLNDDTPSHPKMRGIDPKAGWLWVQGLCYSGQFMTDGNLPGHIARGLAVEVGGEHAGEEHPLISELVQRGLWKATRKGFKIHHYLDYNPSRKKIMVARKSAKARRHKADQERVSAVSASRDDSATDEEASAARRPLTVRNGTVRDDTLRKEREPDPPRVTIKDRTPLEGAEASLADERNLAAHRVVHAASLRFNWRLTKTKHRDELNLALEMLELWDEPEILKGMQTVKKLMTLRWLHDRMAVQDTNGLAAPAPKVASVDLPQMTEEQVARNRQRLRDLLEQNPAKAVPAL